jgi:gliding motility-associated-like protein
MGDVSDNQNCPETITRTYRVEDDCGNFVDVNQQIVINDDINPTASAPANVNVQCIGDVPLANINVITDALDNCTVNPIITHVGDVSDNQTCPETITRTYRIEDDCGNFIEVNQAIIVSDDINPTASNPTTELVQCVGDVSAPDINVVTDALDNCTVYPNIIHVDDVSDNQTCPETITRTYRVIDDCGNTVDVEQSIVIQDDIAPTASNPGAITVTCLGNVPPADITVVADEADNCTVNPLVTLESESSDNNTCNGEVITRIYKITDDCGNQSFVTQTITVDAFLPAYVLSSTNPTTCGGNDGTVTLSGLNPNTNYFFSYNGGTDVTITTDASGEYVLNGLISGNYTSFIVSDFDCPTCNTPNNTSIDLVDPTPPILDGGPDQEVCEGESVILTAGNPDGANISWDNGVNDGVSFVSPVGTTTYTVTAELMNCISTDEVEVLVNPLPTVFAGNDFSVCEDLSVLLSGSGANTYSWDNGVLDGQSFVQSAGTVVYTVTGTSIDGCENTDDVEIIVHPNPVASFEADTTEGCLPLAVQLTSTTLGFIDNCKFTLGDGTELMGCDINYLFTTPGCHDITLTTETIYGCTNSATATNVVCIDDYPIADFSVDPGEVSLLEDEIEITNNTTGAVNYDWNFGDASTGFNVNPTHQYEINDKEEYLITLIAYSNLGCPDTATMLLPVKEELLFYIPNTFTPDDDDFNQTFQPVFTSGVDPQNFTLYIFNRWGELIFESNNLTVGWNGTYGIENTQLKKSGTYLWKVIFKEKGKDKRHEYTGHVNLLR